MSRQRHLARAFSGVSAITCGQQICHNRNTIGIEPPNCIRAEDFEEKHPEYLASGALRATTVIYRGHPHGFNPASTSRDGLPTPHRRAIRPFDHFWSVASLIDNRQPRPLEVVSSANKAPCAEVKRG